MKLIHFVSPDQPTFPRRGLIIEGYPRSAMPAQRWYKRIDSVNLILHVTIGKPRLFKFDYDRREGMARPCYWLRWTFVWPYFGSQRHYVNRMPRTTGFIAWMRNHFEFARGVMPDER